MKKTHILYLIMFASLIWFLRTNLVDLRQVGTAIAQAQWPWLAAAFALRLLYFGLFALIYQAAFGAVGVSSRWRGLLPLTLAAAFIDSTAPMGGTAGMALFVDDARRRQQSPSRTLAGALLFYIAFVGVFLLGLGGVLLFMVGLGMVTALQLTSALVLTAIIVGLIGLLWLGHSHEFRLQQFLQGIQWLANRAGRFVLGQIYWRMAGRHGRQLSLPPPGGRLPRRRVAFGWWYSRLWRHMSLLSLG